MIFFVLLAAALLIHTAYWLLFHYGFRKARRDSEQIHLPSTASSGSTLPPISVIVAARNEEAALPTLLDALAAQSHPHFEVVVVDDASDDDTAEVARRFARQDSRFRLIQVEQPASPRKKNALTLGIASATHERLALTDADCAPPPDWLSVLSAGLSSSGDARQVLLVGYSPFRKRPGLLNHLARYETFVTGFFTAAAVGLGKPYMAVGRNIAYTRALFRAIGGFEHSRASLSGDDDLLVQHVARLHAAEVVHLFDPSTFVPTDAPETWRRWIRQKARHTSASRFYTRDIQVHLALFHTTGLLLWAAPLFLGWTGAALLLARLAVPWLVLRPAARALHERDLLPAFPALELLYAGYTLLIAPLGVLRMPKRW